MANVDTGLNWSAESSYLRNQGPLLLTDINSMSTDQTLSDQLPELSSTEYSVLPVEGRLVSRNSAGAKLLWVGIRPGSPPCILVSTKRGTSQKALIAICTSSSGRIMRAISDGSGAILSETATLRCENRDSTSGLYYTYGSDMNISNMGVASDIQVPYFETAALACAAVTIINEHYYKLNAGYATCCCVRWKDSHNVHKSPILISSDKDAVDLSRDGTNIYTGQSKTTFLYNGLRFYMAWVERGDSGDFTDSVIPSVIFDVTSAGAPVFTPARMFATLADGDHENILILSTVNPYGPDPSVEGGGDGQDPDDDEVPLEPVTFPSAINTGFCRIYCPSASDLSALSDYLWGPLFDLDTVKRLFADPMSSVLGLSVVPLSVSGISTPVSIAGVSTGISLPKLSVQHINVDLGSLQVTEKWGAYLDYEPYTKYSVYLPFIGYRTISADDIMGKWVHLSYDIDLLSGACVAKLVSGSTLLYQWAGSCAMQLPVNAANWNSVISSGLAAIGSTATAIASGGAAAPVVAGALASAGTLATQMKPNIERAGGLSGAAAFLAGRRAYMIRTMPELINPGDQPHYIGYPSFVTKQLGTLAGYNVVEDIHLEGIPATQAELEEIDTLLHEGVIL